MNTDLILDAAAGVCLVVGALMSLAAAIGLLRFPDLLSRMHAATKPQVFGLLLLLTGLGLQLRSWAVAPLLLLAWLFQLLTVPVSAHMVGRAGYRTKHLRPELLVIDELDDVVERAQRLLQDAEADEMENDAADPRVDDDPGAAAYPGELDDAELPAARQRKPQE